MGAARVLAIWRHDANRDQAPGFFSRSGAHSWPLWGIWVRSGPDDTNGQSANKTDEGKEGKSDRDLGNALRRAYDDAVSEGIPDDLLDLLKKLD